MFRDEVAQGRADAETEVRARLVLPSHGATAPEITHKTAHESTKQLQRGND